jgi:hypothetical protein
MAKTKNFNNGTLEFQGNTVTWSLPDHFANYSQLQDFDYLKLDRSFSIPLTSVDRVGDYLRFQWEMDQDYQPFQSIRRNNALVKLKIAFKLIAIGEEFEKNEEMATLFEPSNLFIDPFSNVHLLFWTNPIQLPCEDYYKKDEVEQMKWLIALLFTSLSYEQIKETAHDVIVSKSVKGYKEFVYKLMKAKNFYDLRQLISNETDRIQTLHYEAIENKKKQAQEVKINPFKDKKVILTLGGFAGAFLLSTMFVFTAMTIASDRQTELSLLSERSQEAIQQHEVDEWRINAYQAYFDQDIETALQELKKLEGQMNEEDISFYRELRIQNGEAQALIEENPEYTEEVLAYLIELERTDDILTLESDHIQVRFEKAVIKEDIDTLILIKDQLTAPTERQQRIMFDAYNQSSPTLGFDYAKEIENIEFQMIALETQKEKLSKQLEDDEDNKELEDQMKKINANLEKLQLQQEEMERE